jgi:predicted flap endonuclease-1-like 5' DNA nuclease
MIAILFLISYTRPQLKHVWFVNPFGELSMSSFACCIWWLVFGVLLGWLLSWWLNKLLGNNKDNEQIDNRDDFLRSSQQFTASPEPVPTSAYTPVSQPDAAATVKFVSRPDMIRAAEAAGISFSGKKNDLEIIEGIGPKIAMLLSDNGIDTFEKLSNASLDMLNSILAQGGDNFRLANPSTWAQQGLLAAENKWQELKALQDSLDGGIKKP